VTNIAKTLAYYDMAKITAVKSFMSLAPEVFIKFINELYGSISFNLFDIYINKYG
jgi:hypothetical protein